jgi:hypothetical protein
VFILQKVAGAILLEMNPKSQKAKKWKNVYICLACGKRSFRYSIIRDHISFRHPEICLNYKDYILMYRRLRYEQYLSLKQIAKTIKAIKGKVKMPLRMYL